MAYLLSCIDQFNQIDSSEHKIKETMNDFSKKLDEEIKQFEEKFPPGLGDHILDLFFSYNFFKKNVIKTLLGKEPEGNLAEEYEKQVFKNKRLDALLKMSYENLLFDMHIKFESFYCNVENKLRTKVPLENMDFNDMIATKDYQKWVNDFLKDHQEFSDLTVTVINARMSYLFSGIVYDFRNKFLAQEMRKRSMNYALIY